MTSIENPDRVEGGKPTTRPGRLQSQTTLTIHTHYAQTFVNGRVGDEAIGKYHIPGLYDFSRRTRLIWLSVIADDPYADWQLLKIEALLDQANNRLADNDEIVRSRLQSQSTLAVQPAQSTQPVTIQLNIQNPYAYLAAMLIRDYDQFACVIFSAMQVGLLTRKAGHQFLHKAGVSIRRLFGSTYEWKFTGVTRSDFMDQTPLAKRAVELMGVCPPDVFEKKRRGRIAPEIESPVGEG